MSLFANYQKLRGFIERNYYTNPAYAINNVAQIQEEFRQYVILWDSWYRGYVEDFHEYEVYNGDNFITKKKRSLQMAKKVCEDRADLLLNEQIKITVEDQTAQETIDKVLNDQSNAFRSKSNELIEKMCALGTGAYVEFRDRNKTCIDYVTTDKVIPITIENGRVIDCAFASASRYGNEETIYLNVHVRIYPVDEYTTDEALEQRREMGISDDYDGYLIANHFLKIEEGEYKAQEIPPDMKEFFLTGSPEPRFQIIKPAKANNIAYNEIGLGVSIFSNALDQLCSVDEVYNSYVVEFENGISKIFVHDEMAQIKIDTEGGETVMKPLFDKRDTVYYATDLGEDQEKIKHVQSELRVEGHETGLNRMLNLLGFKCGFGNNYYKFEGGIIKTATEVISENNPLYKSVKKDQHILREAIKGLVKNILILSNEFDNTSFNVEQTITVEFDDSIFEDTATIRKNAMLEFNAGLIDQIGYYMKAYKLTKEQATILWREIESRMLKENDVDMIGGGA